MVINTAKCSKKVADNIVEFVANLMDIEDVKTISYQSTLSELCLESDGGRDEEKLGKQTCLF